MGCSGRVDSWSLFLLPISSTSIMFCSLEPLRGAEGSGTCSVSLLPYHRYRRENPFPCLTHCLVGVSAKIMISHGLERVRVPGWAAWFRADWSGFRLSLGMITAGFGQPDTCSPSHLVEIESAKETLTSRCFFCWAAVCALEEACWAELKCCRPCQLCRQTTWIWKVHRPMFLSRRIETRSGDS